MLREVLIANRADLIERCRAKVLKRPVGRSESEESTHGIPIFLAQLIEMLELDAGAFDISRESDPQRALSGRIAVTAEKHGKAQRDRGLTAEQVVHGYGDLCQAITELAYERNSQIQPGEFHTLNRLLDNAIAAAVMAHGVRGADPPRLPWPA